MKGLGQLETKVMDVLWDAQTEPLRVRDVLERLAPQPPLAYTTVMTVLDNLHSKGWVVRHKEGKGYRYLPTASREAVAAQAIRELLDSVSDAEAVLLHFAERATERHLAALRAALDGRAER